MPTNRGKQGVLEADPFGVEPVTGETMRIFKQPDVAPPVSGRPPLEGGPRAEGVAADRICGDAADTAQMRGAQETFVLARHDQDRTQTPVWLAEEDSDERVVAVFTEWQKALLYLQAAGWLETLEPRSLSPADLAAWLGDARAAGIRFAAVDPDRLGHELGEGQPAVSLDALTDWSDDAIFWKLREIGKP